MEIIETCQRYSVVQGEPEEKRDGWGPLLFEGVSRRHKGGRFLPRLWKEEDVVLKRRLLLFTTLVHNAHRVLSILRVNISCWGTFLLEFMMDHPKYN